LGEQCSGNAHSALVVSCHYCAGQKAKTAGPLQRNLPLGFQGWNHPERFGADYLQHFGRPRESVRRAALLSAAANEAKNSFASLSSSLQFAPSALPGLLLRPSPGVNRAR
jgi:hypothetical protein